MKVRFAPSPTGRLHAGNIRIGLINWLFARKCGGSFALRIDDTDFERSTEAFEQGIYQDLEWLGLRWDQLEHQSRRIPLYEQAAEKLKAAGWLYPAYETSEELDYKRKRQMARGRPPVYDRAALSLTAEDKARQEAEGRRPHWRFRLERGEARWDDLVRGACHFDVGSISDPILIREDGSFLYTLPSVVDDLEMGISHIVRGEDHVANTAAQIRIFEALGGETPVFAHLPLLTDSRGQGLSKRTGSASISELREGGLEPMAINSLLAGLGRSDAIEAAQTLDALADRFDMAKFGRATPKFDDAQLWRLNAQILHGLPLDQVKNRLAAMGVTADDAFWSAIHDNLERLADAKIWRQVCDGPVNPAIDPQDADWLAAAARLLPPEPWGEEVWPGWINLVKQQSGRKGKELFHPLRLALTGREGGPEMKALLPLIGYRRAVERLCGRSA